MRYPCRKGFTLVEIMTVSAISVILIGSLLMFLIRGFRIINTGEKSIELQQELNRALVWISDDLKQTAPAQINLPANGQWLNLGAFNIPTGVNPAGRIIWPINNWNIVYNLSDNNLARTFNGQTMVVANSLTRAVYRRTAANPREVEVVLNATNQTGYGIMQDSIVFNVTMRNQ